MTTDIYRRILSRTEFASKPPVCVDIGASGDIAPQWRELAPHSICLAFDADERDFSADEICNAEWLRLLKINRLVGVAQNDSVPFYLTQYPHCSSSLVPDNEALRPWAFRDLFEVKKITNLPTVSISSALDELGLAYIDWYKSDTQGTDLKLFQTLPIDIQDNVLALDFEPGIIDAYVGEDKLHQLMAYMDDRPFFMCDMVVKGSQRMPIEANAKLQSLNISPSVVKNSPGWAEISYLNTFQNNPHSLRSYLLGWIFSTIKSQHGHALWLALRGYAEYGDSMFLECESWTQNRLLMDISKPKQSFVRRLVARIKRAIQ